MRGGIGRAALISTQKQRWLAAYLDVLICGPNSTVPGRSQGMGSKSRTCRGAGCLGASRCRGRGGGCGTDRLCLAP